MKQPKMPRASTNPLADESLDGGADQGLDPDVAIQKGMPARNLKSILMMVALVGVGVFMLWSNNFKTAKPKDPPPVRPSTENVVDDLIDGLKNPPVPYAPSEIKAPTPEPMLQAQVEPVDERLQAALVAPMDASDVNINSGVKVVQQQRASVDDRIRNLMAEQRTIADNRAKESYQRQMEDLRAMGLAPGGAAGAAAGGMAGIGSGQGGNITSGQDTMHARFIEDQMRRSDLADSTKVVAARKGHTLYEGTIVRAVLTRSLKTDLPGMITAKVTSDLYDTLTQKVVLVPRGSEITCNYQPTLMVGQKLVLAACNRLRLPNGRSFSLHAASASDMQGASGLPADIDNHFWEMFRDALIVGAASYLLPDEDRRTTANSTASGTQVVGSVLGTTLGKVIDATIGRNVRIPPTGHVEVGTPFTLTLSRDVELEPYFTR
ncbi:TrbI/VirB10 family protein [Hydrogenophaga sp. NFH-34]|uniref:TrbI/VirB10 family protein n=1 Tax=Hydrogenophaga sp. NFH-34 TaxID=2744446 RepID=UPI001F399E5E|nr:TrbI/VirB10 family protein [Hydrogenophaga sp. NFH-34]